jgi:hypothetical protein
MMALSLSGCHHQAHRWRSVLLCSKGYHCGWREGVVVNWCQLIQMDVHPSQDDTATRLSSDALTDVMRSL